MKKNKLVIIFIIALAFSPLVANAFTTESGNAVHVSSLEVADGNLYAAGNNITIDGTVNGDVICAGETVVVNGTVNGDVICAGKSLIINGEVKGSSRLLASEINVNGKIDRNLNAFASSVILGKDSLILLDALIFSPILESRGNISGYLHGGASSVIISGKVAKDIYLKIDGNSSAGRGLKIEKEAVINGDLHYSAQKEAVIESPSSITGKTEREELPVKSFDWSKFFWGKIMGIFSALAVGLVFVSLWKNKVEDVLAIIDKKTWPVFWRGLLFMAVLPLISLILLFTIIGIPLSLILVFVWLSGLFVGKIFTAIFLGDWLIKKCKKIKENIYISLVLGVIVLWLVCTIPFFGWLISLAAIWLGVGAILFFIQGRTK